MILRYAIVIPKGPSHSAAAGAADRIASIPQLREQTSVGAALIFSNRVVERIREGSATSCLLGCLFDRATWQTTAGGSPAGMSLAGTLSAYWGQYVLVRSDGGDQVTVLRDPTGALPCYYLRTSDVIVFASDADVLIASGLLKHEICMPALMRHVVNPTLRRAETCQVGLVELLPGTGIVACPDGAAVRTFWSPWQHAGREQQITSMAAAVDIVGATVNEAVGALARRHRHVVLGVSGGLDSSIVAAAIKKADVDLTCITLATNERSGDERTYARDLSGHLQVPLVEAFEDASLVDVHRSGSAHLPRPVARTFAQSADALQRRLAARVGADAFFHGGGGDNVFCYLPSATPIADRFRCDGPVGGWSTIRDIIDLTGCSLGQAVRGGIRRAWFRDAAYRWPADTRFLSASAIAAGADARDHDWLRVPPGGLPGKAMHIAMILGAQNYIEGFERETEYPVVAPLLAQPVVEACLRIPTWFWCTGGVNRAVARQAFESVLPSSIIERVVKGTPTSFSFELVEQNRSDIRSMLEEGNLARAGLVDVASVQGALSPSRRLESQDCSRLLSLVGVEAWMDAWNGRREREPTADRANQAVDGSTPPIDQSSRLGV